ncbi:hypothetical protein ANN_05204 [Periplaneta americana]|uniref:Uncharacterized protein n=1 Tax=Periplaneta americana TaxID=6978 RepID=A0ABQ8TAF3_PERAM|nr:hypothetical protein ANN_05204 [Periplaneta americana]
MVGLCEGGNALPESLKGITTRIKQLDCVLAVAPVCERLCALVGLLSVGLLSLLPRSWMHTESDAARRNILSVVLVSLISYDVQNQTRQDGREQTQETRGDDIELELGREQVDDWLMSVDLWKAASGFYSTGHKNASLKFYLFPVPFSTLRPSPGSNVKLCPMPFVAFRSEKVLFFVIGAAERTGTASK